MEFNLSVILAVVGVVLLLGLLIKVVRRRDDTTLLNLLDEQPSGDDLERDDNLCMERRRSKRRQDKYAVVEVCGTHNKGSPARGYVVDQSKGGVGVALPVGASLGDVLQLRAVTTNDGAEWIEVEVVHIKPLSKHYVQLGCKFVKDPPCSALALFE